jgi:hypothetical protein
MLMDHKEDRLNGVLSRREKKEKKGVLFLRIIRCQRRADLLNYVEEYTHRSFCFLNMRIGGNADQDFEEVREYKQYTEVLLLRGGVFPTFAPEIV